MKKFTPLFILVMVAQLLAIYFHDSYPWLEFISKPLIITSLFLFLIINTKGIKCRFKNWVLIALVFSLMGDVFLMLLEDNPDYFMYGLLAFLMSHIFYIIAFSTSVHKPLSIPLFRKYPLTYIIPYAFSAYIYSILKPDLGDLSIPVLIYIIVISTMLAVAFNRYGKLNNNSFVWVLLGALLFVGSDTILALDKFHSNIEYSRYYIMLTYMMAQFFIVKGANSQIKEQGSYEE